MIFNGMKVNPTMVSKKEVVGGQCPECGAVGSIINKICSNCGKIFPNYNNEYRPKKLGKEEVQRIVQERANKLMQEDPNLGQEKQDDGIKIKSQNKTPREVLRYVKGFIEQNMDTMRDISEVVITITNGKVQMEASVKQRINV